MRHFLTVILLLAVIPATAQDYLRESATVYNVYRRDATVIAEYNKEFIKTIKNISTIKEDSGIVSGIFTFQWDKKGFDNGIITVPVKLEAKDSRGRISFIEPTYTVNNDKYPAAGTLASLFETKRQSIIITNLKTYYKELTRSISEKYHDFLKEKSKDNNW